MQERTPPFDTKEGIIVGHLKGGRELVRRERCKSLACGDEWLRSKNSITEGI
jgi:hypothetical protein